MLLKMDALEGACPGGGGGEEGGEGGAGEGGFVLAKGAEALPQAVKRRAESKSEKLQNLFTSPGTDPSKL